MTAASPLLSLISNQLSRLKPKVICGHRPFPLPLCFYSILPLCPLVLTCHSLSSLHAVPFSSFILPAPSSVFPPLPPKPKPCPPLALCLLSVNSFFPLLVCWPRLTYFSLYLRFRCRSLTLSLSFCLFGSSPSSLALSGKHKIACICVRTNTRAGRCTCSYRGGPNPCCEPLFPRRHAHTHTCYHDEVIPRVQSDRSL